MSGIPYSALETERKSRTRAGWGPENTEAGGARVS